MSPSAGSPSSQPQLMLEPYHVSQKITKILQWVSVFYIFNSVYVERFNNYTFNS